MKTRVPQAYKYHVTTFHRWRYFHPTCYDQWAQLMAKQLGGTLPETKRVFVVPPQTHCICCKKSFAEEDRPHAPKRVSHRQYRCRYCGTHLNAWLPAAQCPEASMLLYHLGQHHLEEAGPYL